MFTENPRVTSFIQDRFSDLYCMFKIISYEIIRSISYKITYDLVNYSEQELYYAAKEYFNNDKQNFSGDTNSTTIDL